MKSEGFPRRFSHRKWVEGPLEGMDELAADLEEHKQTLQAGLGLSAMGLFALLVLLIAGLLVDIWGFIWPLFSSAPFPSDASFYLARIALTVLFISFGFAAAMLSLQVLKFLVVTIMRFENVQDLFGAEPGACEASTRTDRGCPIARLTAVS